MPGTVEIRPKTVAAVEPRNALPYPRDDAGLARGLAIPNGIQAGFAA
jgi:hypothetical protein